VSGFRSGLVLGCFFGLELELALGFSIFGKFWYLKGKKGMKECLL
jgi:hypothetical protein